METTHIENSNSQTENQRTENITAYPTDFKPKTEAEINKEQKSRRIENIIGAIGDSISNVSNLFFTSQGSPSLIGTKKTTTLGTAISERHKAEDKLYEDRFKAWEKRQENIKKENEARQENEKLNMRLILTPELSVKESNWGQKDFIDELFDGIQKWNRDPNLSQLLSKMRYKYEPIWDKFQFNLSHTEGNDKEIDLFEGKSGTYYKRDLIWEILSQDSWTTPENKNNLINEIKIFDENWLPLK